MLFPNTVAFWGTGVYYDNIWIWGDTIHPAAVTIPILKMRKAIEWLAQDIIASEN